MSARPERVRRLCKTVLCLSLAAGGGVLSAGVAHAQECRTVDDVVKLIQRSQQEQAKAPPQCRPQGPSMRAAKIEPTWDDPRSAYLGRQISEDPDIDRQLADDKVWQDNYCNRNFIQRALTPGGNPAAGGNPSLIDWITIMAPKPLSMMPGGRPPNAKAPANTTPAVACPPCGKTTVQQAAERGMWTAGRRLGGNDRGAYEVLGNPEVVFKPTGGTRPALNEGYQAALDEGLASDLKLGYAHVDGQGQAAGFTMPRSGSTLSQLGRAGEQVPRCLVDSFKSEIQNTTRIRLLDMNPDNVALSRDESRLVIIDFGNCNACSPNNPVPPFVRPGVPQRPSFLPPPPMSRSVGDANWAKLSDLFPR